MLIRNLQGGRQEAFTAYRPANLSFDMQAPGFVFRDQEVERRPLNLYEVQNAVLSFNKCGCSLFDARGNVCVDLKDSWGEVETGERDVVDALELDGVCFSIIPFRGRKNFSHFLLEGVARLLALRKLAPEVTPRYILCDGLMRAETEAFLALLGVEGELVFLPVEGTVKCRTIFVFEALKHPMHYANPELADMYRNLGRDIRSSECASPDQYARKIFVGRRRGRRGIANEREVNVILEQHGYLLVNLDEMSPAEQVATFNTAEVIAGVHGAGLSNIVFCDAGATLVEIVPARYATPAFWYLASGLGMRYFALPEIGGWTGDNEPPTKFNDLTIDVDSLDECLALVAK